MPADIPAPTGSGNTVTPTVLRISTGARTSVAVLGILFDGLMVWLLIFSLARFAGIGLAIFIGAVIAAMTWALWKTIQTRMILTDDQVILKYAFFPTVRINRSTITGVELRNVSYNGLGGGNVYTPYVATSDGRTRPVLMMGRRSQGRALDQISNLRRHLGL